MAMIEETWAKKVDGTVKMAELVIDTTNEFEGGVVKVTAKALRNLLTEAGYSRAEVN